MILEIILHSRGSFLLSCLLCSFHLSRVLFYSFRVFSGVVRRNLLTWSTVERFYLLKIVIFPLTKIMVGHILAG